MISAVESKIGKRKRFYKNLVSIGKNLYQLKILDWESYFETLTHIKSFSHVLKTSFRNKKNNETISLKYFQGLIEEMEVFNESKELTIQNVL
ncbi:hypothetical protein, partial [Mammaliicoccus lentus]|uniref:hypothetical protein n=1 Tax=Mammaliicoccus lentus TaxID=42858 RepID=UPI001290323C